MWYFFILEKSEGNVLTASKAFTTISLFGILELPIRLLGFVL